MSDSTLLRRALLANAAFSTLTGLDLLFGGRFLAEPLGLPAVALIVVGLSLLPFAAGVAWLARDPLARPRLAFAVSLADLGWVVGTLLLLATPYPATSLGRWVAVTVALVVGACAAGQLAGLHRAQVASLRAAT